MLRAGAAGVRSRRHAGKPQDAHEPPYPFAVDPMPYAAQINGHLAAAEEGVPCVFGVDLHQKDRFQLVRFSGQMRRVEGGAVHARQLTLSGQRQGVRGIQPVPPVLYRPIPDFFLSQSRSIFNRPISEYRRS